MSETPSLFTPEESAAIKTSWKKLTKKGVGPVGQLILHRFLTDVPEIRHLFQRIGIDEDAPKTYMLAKLKKNKVFCKHAKQVAKAINMLVKNLDDTDTIVEACKDVGRVHVQHRVSPHHFDLLGEVIVNVLKEALGHDDTHPTIKAWIKAYGAIAATAKSGMEEEQSKSNESVEVEIVTKE